MTALPVTLCRYIFPSEITGDRGLVITHACPSIRDSNGCNVVRPSGDRNRSLRAGLTHFRS